MTKSRGINRPKAKWTREKLAELVRRYPHEPTKQLAADLGFSVTSTYQKANGLGVVKTAAYMASPDACRLRRGDQVGKSFRYPKGHVPANKGLRRPGWSPGNMASTQFKPGTRSGRAEKVYQPVGAERVSKDGYLERKTNERMPFQKRWRAVHLLVWEETNGPLPKGHAIAFRDGDKTNRSIANLELITRAELMRRNTIHNYPEDLKSVIRVKAKLTRKINGIHKRN